MGETVAWFDDFRPDMDVFLNLARATKTAVEHGRGICSAWLSYREMQQRARRFERVVRYKAPGMPTHRRLALEEYVRDDPQFVSDVQAMQDHLDDLSSDLEDVVDCLPAWAWLHKLYIRATVLRSQRRMSEAMRDFLLVLTDLQYQGTETISFDDLIKAIHA